MFLPFLFSSMHYISCKTYTSYWKHIFAPSTVPCLVTTCVICVHSTTSELIYSSKFFHAFHAFVAPETPMTMTTVLLLLVTKHFGLNLAVKTKPVCIKVFQ